MLFWLMGSTGPHSGGGRKSDVERKFRVTGSGNRKRQSPQLESLRSWADGGGLHASRRVNVAEKSPSLGEEQQQRR